MDMTIQLNTVPMFMLLLPEDNHGYLRVQVVHQILPLLEAVFQMLTMVISTNLVDITEVLILVPALDIFLIMPVISLQA